MRKGGGLLRCWNGGWDVGGEEGEGKVGEGGEEREGKGRGRGKGRENRVIVDE